ncbi:VOC family protein, partial [Nocardiopsis sp. MG754419]|uniref:VOC family protein n=1 Tax=Nocardiopsis sp. MG754419 TaxID=2259865 RepID=UPI001BAB15C0
MYDQRPGFDHFPHWVPDVGEAARRYTDAGFQNGVRRLDERYVELFTVLDDAAYGTGVFGRALTTLRPAIEDVATRGGAMTFAVDVTDAAASAQRLRLAGHHVEGLRRRRAVQDEAIATAGELLTCWPRVEQRRVPRMTVLSRCAPAVAVERRRGQPDRYDRGRVAEVAA